MKTALKDKSTNKEIQKRFDVDVERFSDLNTGQSSTIDAPLSMELITRAAIACTPRAKKILDIGCGAGNNTIKLLQLNDNLDCDLIDLSLPMLKKAQERICAKTSGIVQTFQCDIRNAILPVEYYDIIIAAAVFHHLRDSHDWEETFKRIYNLTAPGGSVWITDLVSHENKYVQEMMWERYGEYLESINGADYREKVFEYIDREDSPRPVTFQIDLLRKVGFSKVDLLHKNSCFSAFGAIK